MNEYKITALRKQRGRLYCVELSDGTQVLLDRKTLEDCGVKEGATFTDAQWEKLVALCEQNRAREKALWLLSRRDYSVRELEIRFAFETEWSASGKSIRSRTFYNALKQRIEESRVSA